MSSDSTNANVNEEQLPSPPQIIYTKSTYDGTVHNNPQTFRDGEIKIINDGQDNNGAQVPVEQNTRKHFINACNAITSRAQADRYLKALKAHVECLPTEDELNLEQQMLGQAPGQAPTYAAPPAAASQREERANSAGSILLKDK